MEEEDYNLAERYRVVRRHLDRLGYRQALSLDALPLIEKLLADLIQTTDSLKHFKTVAQDNIEACSQLQLATEPYKCDNARLVQECNQLHLKLLETNESHQKQIKELKKQVRKLEIDSSNLQLVSSRNIKKIKDLEAESAGKSSKILELQGKCCKPVISNTNLATKKRACYPLRRPTLEADPLPRTGSSSTTLPSSSNVDSHVVDLLGMADHRMNCLNREVTKLKGDLSIQSDNIHTLKSQLATKEKEIIRLKKMLDGGRPLSAVTKDCFCKKVEKSHCGDIGGVKVLERAKQDLEEQLKDSMSKQHEAMSRALKLAERNEELEKELRDIDHIALAVEADCNSVVQENNRRVGRLQEKVEDLMTQVHVLESELTVERREVQEMRADLEACKLEKRNIQRVLESTLDEKKQMTDRINQLTIIEKDLNDTIERLTKTCVTQRQEITHLESCNNILKDQMHAGGGGDDREKNKEKGEKNDKNKGKKIPKKRTAAKTQSTLPTANKHSVNGNMEDVVSKDMPSTIPIEIRTFENQKAENEKDSTIDSLKITIGRLETERDYYRNEYNKFRDEFNLISNGDNADLWTQACELRRQLNEKDQAMSELQREKKALDREKFNLEARLQSSKNQQRRPCIPCSPCSPCKLSGSCKCSTSPSGDDVSSRKAMLERLERERDTARADVDRLVEERDALRERLKIAVDAHTSEQRRLRENLLEAETRLKQLETERQDLMLSQGTRRATINGLEDQLEDLRLELKRTKEELTTQRTQYFQLRALQEQTDQALGDVQGQLGQSETELNKMMDHKRHIEQQQMQLDNQVKEFKQECNMLRSNLAQLDQEKDQLLMNLDEKTERIAALEREVRFKEQQKNGLEQQVLDFQHKYQICVDQTAEQERQMRTMEVEISNLQRQLTSASMDRENAIRENARLQDDLAAVTCECRNLQRELEVSRAESYDLKHQLQTYVTEVRRAEDLLNRKENERSEMLNHFRSLSLEATVLETNNQSLESEAAEARDALQTAQDRLLDLERQIADRDCLIRGYETQIAELTQNVASMETQLHQQGDQRKRAEADLNAVRDLCVKLDQQKESLEAQLVDKESMRVQCETQLTRLRADQNMVQDQMSRDNAAVDRLEAMLSQARQESMSNQAINQELQSETARLKQKIGDLQNKLLGETSELRRYQNQAAEYSKQISELRRQMTNERFDRARKEEESRRAKSPRSFQKQTCPPSSTSQGPTPAPRPDPTSVNQWKTPAPSRRTLEESNQDCCRYTDLKTEAQRTNRFNANPVSNSTTSFLTPCNHRESKTGVPVADKTQEKEEIPCINIILKPVVGAKTDQKEESMQIVEITAVTDNINSHCIGNSNAVLPVANRSQLQCTSKAIEKVEIKCVPVPSKVEKKLCDVCVQTPADPTDQKNVVVPVINQRTPEDTVRKLNTSQSVANTDMSTPHRGVQFRDNGIVADNTNSCNWNLSNTVRPNVQYLPKDSSSYSGNSVDILNMDSAISCCSQTQPMKTTIQEISMHPTQRFGSTDTLRESVESTSKPTEISDIKSCVKNSGRETEDKLSDRIKRKIDSLEGGTCVSTQSSIQDTNVSLGPQHGSFRTQTNTLLCTDICKDMASQAKFFKTYTDRSNASDADSSVSTQYTNILPSVFSNNPSIPHITLDTTETLEWKSPSRNQSSKATVGAVMPSSSLYVSPDNTDNYLSQNFTVEDISSGSRMNQDYSRNLLSEQQHPAYDRVRVSGTEDTKSRGPEKRIAKLDSTTGTRAYWTDEAIDLSKIGFNEDSFIQPEHINTSDEVNTSHIIGSSSLIRDRIEDTTLNHNKSFKNIAVGTNLLSFPPIGEYRAATNTNCENKPQYALSKPNTRNIIRSSDLTRPEFIRMLTEIKERTCGLEKQLSAMNEAIKRKQAIRNKEHRATVKHHEAMRQDHFPYKTQDNKIRTTDELPFNTSELSSIEAAQPSLEVSKIKPSIAISHCGPLHDISISENKFHNDKTFHGRMIQSNQNDNFSPLQPRRVPKTSTPTNWSPEQEQISIVCGELNVSVSKQKPKKPIFKTKRNYLPYRHLGQSDHKIWKHRVHNTTPSVKSMTASTDPLEPASLESYMVSSKIDTHSSPTNCCDIPETSGQTPSLQTVFDARCISNAVVRSGGCAISSNRHIHRMAMQPSSCDLDETKDSNTQLNCCLGTEVTDTVLGVLMKNKEHVNPNFASQVKRFKLKPRQGIEQSFVKSRTKRDPQSIPSNTILSSSTSRTSFHESLSSICAKKRVNQYDSAKPSSFKLKNSGAVEVLNHNVEADDSQSYFDPVCCSTMRNDEIVSGENVPLPSKQTESIPVEQPKQYSGKDENYACPIMTQQATPISLNTDSNFKSEEEESSMDYDLNKSA